MDAFTQAYIECALWSSNDNSDPETGGNPLDDNYGPEDIAPETLAKMAADCADFQKGNANHLSAAAESGEDDERAGHDFWLTRHGHGAGFWDRGLGKIGDYLTSAAKVYGSVDLYVGDDGRIYA